MSPQSQSLATWFHKLIPSFVIMEPLQVIIVLLSYSRLIESIDLKLEFWWPEALIFQHENGTVYWNLSVACPNCCSI